MRRIVILDTWTNDTNLGNRIIMEAVTRELASMFSEDFFYHVPALEFVRAGRDLVRRADLIFLGGTNVLSADMNRTSDWRVRLRDAFWSGRVTLMGVGWWKYQSRQINLYTRLLLSRVLGRKWCHSVRDGYSMERLRKAGVESLNTGCPSLWGIDAEHCRAIPTVRSEEAVLTFTEYLQDPVLDALLLKTVAASYRKVHFWGQQYGDYAYARALGGADLIWIPPTLEAYDAFLASRDVDYVGTRLHGGIRAIQHGRRSVIVAIDNRASEMGREVRLPIVERVAVGEELESLLNREWATDITVDRGAVLAWKRQFFEGR